jgi:hypothetical protein
MQISILFVRIKVEPLQGRFSYSNPNLQQIPARNKDLGPKIRSLFIPEKNHKWGCFDYSQQEPRLVVHFAASTDPIMFDDSVINIVEKFKNDSVDFTKPLQTWPIFLDLKLKQLILDYFMEWVKLSYKQN